MPPEPDCRAIACNAVAPTAAYSRGALAFVQQIAGDRLRVLIRSRGSRWVRVWLPIKKLGNFRFKSLPESHPLFGRVGDFFDDESLAAIAARGAGQNLHLR